MKNLEEIGRQMPYSMPEGFIDGMTERVLSAVCTESRTSRRTGWLWGAVSGVAAAAALALIVANPFDSGFDVPDYESISECKSIDEVFESMSSDDLEMFSMVSNYYGE